MNIVPKNLRLLGLKRSLHFRRALLFEQLDEPLEPGRSVRGECANFTRLVLGGGGGRPDYLQKLKVPEGYEKMIDYSNM